MSFRIAIPSYKRITTLQKKTLRFLRNEGIPASQIDIFVASKEEQAVYAAALGSEYTLIIGTVGINKQREFMESYYPIGSRILFLDDDVRAIKTVYPGVPFDVLVERMFDVTEENGIKLFGVYPTDSGLCLKDVAFKGLSYCIGACYGIIISEFKPKYPHPVTEDYTRSILYYQHSGLLRFEGIGIQTHYFKEPGGLQEYRTIERQEKEMKALVARWPSLLRLRQRAGRMTDVRFTRVKREHVASPFGTI